MPIDPSIAMGYRPPQIANPLEQYAQVAAIQHAQNQNRLADLMYSEKQRDLQAENALAKLLSTGAKDQDVMSGLATQGFGNKALAYQKQLIEQQKTQSEIGKNQAEAQSKVMDATKAAHALRGAVFGGIAKAPTYENAVAQIGQINATLPASMRIDPNSVPQDPAQLKEWATSNFMSTIDAAKQLEDARVKSEGEANRKNQLQIAQGHDATSRANNAATVAATVRGQDKPVWDSERGVWVDPKGGFKAPSGGTGEALPPKASDVTNLRKEFDNLPEVKNYKQAFPSYAAIKDAASRQGPQADINLIYGMAKLYDPNSVVREGEYATIANSQAIPERIKSLAQQLAGGGKLTPETKKQLLTEAEGRIATYEGEYSKSRGSYTEIASKGGIDPASVFPDAGRFKSVKVGNQTLTAQQAADGKFYVQKDGKYFEVR